MAKSYYQMLFNTAASQNVLPKSMEKTFLAEEYGETSNQVMLTMSDFKSSAKDDSICRRKIEHYAKEALTDLYSANLLENQIINSSIKRKQFQNKLDEFKPMTSIRIAGGPMRSQSRSSDIVPSQIRMETEDVEPVPESPKKAIEIEKILGMDMTELLVSKIEQREKKRVEILKLAEKGLADNSKISISKSGLASGSKTNLFVSSKSNFLTVTGINFENPQKTKEEARKKKIEEVMEMMEDAVVQMDTSCKGSKSFKLFYDLPREAILKEEKNFNAIIEALRLIPDNDSLARHFHKSCNQKKIERRYRSELEREFAKIKNTRYIRHFQPFKKNSVSSRSQSLQPNLEYM